ncbi:PREDICTED: uncharacterized protein LOC106747890 [Dinoponera quadriceps]|uniref:Uncharacterized protein LOC106747890 n=1 Tax=Dinoponera quadriceps TaxID=609295 RepID=A0A6P3XTJ5_DINQU|nr:PREDICTED: uncharacterized protein LOC106747890 [Dinoponera quadriceps]
MKIRGGWFNAWWCVTWALLLNVSARPLREEANEMYIGHPRSFDSTAAGYGFGRISASKSSGNADDSLEELEEDEEEGEVPSTMRAITARAKSEPVLLPLIIEPEAEMLPPGYKGVKPPGVSHMELVLVKPQTDRSGSRRSATSPTDDENPGKPDGFERDRDAYHAASEREVMRDDRGSDRRVASELSATGDTKRESERSERVESSGKGEGYSENENRAGKRADEIEGKKDVTVYESGDSREGVRNAGGYRNVYHRDESKKDADFYDNDRRGGHFEEHGRYDEKYAAEGMYGKAGSYESRVVKAKTNKRRKSEGTRAS